MQKLEKTKGGYVPRGKMLFGNRTSKGMLSLKEHENVRELIEAYFAVKYDFDINDKAKGEQIMTLAFDLQELEGKLKLNK